MDGNTTLGLLGSPAGGGGVGGGGGGGGRVASGGSATGSISNVSKEDQNNNSSNSSNLVLSSEVSSSYSYEAELELGLGLSIGGGGCGGGSGGLRSKPPPAAGWGQYARILTAKDLPSLVVPNSSSSSSSSSLINPNSSKSGTKRTATTDPVSPPNGASQVVGWPPIRAYRMNSLVSQTKLPNDDVNSIVEENKNKDVIANNANSGSNTSHKKSKEKGALKSSLFVKVNMDGTLIGRKVDLNAHSGYETLAQTLEDMFHGPTTRRLNTKENDTMTQRAGPSKLLDGSSEFVLTYEDKDGDWMLVGDVPWRMFVSSVKRLRIMRTAEANGLSPRFQESNGRQRV